MEISKNNWSELANIVERSIKKSFYCSAATVDESGTPHVTPIGSIVFTDVGKGFYFEGFLKNSAKNLRTNSDICFMAVDTSMIYMIKFFITGKLDRLPGVRLYGTSGEKRRANAQESRLWNERIKRYKKLKGYDILWKDLHYGREVNFHSYEPVSFGNSTKETVARLNHG